MFRTGLEYWWYCNVTSCKPMSSAKEMATSIALASASSGPSGSRSCVLKAASMAPAWLHTMTSIPTDLVFLTIAASILTLYHRKTGGVHLASSAALGWQYRKYVRWKSSASIDRAFIMMSWLDCRGEPSLVLFLLYHMHQEIVITSSSMYINQHSIFIII